jgi:hypothetical protein
MANTRRGNLRRAIVLHASSHVDGMESGWCRDGRGAGEGADKAIEQGRTACELFDEVTALRQRIAELESRTVKLPAYGRLYLGTDMSGLMVFITTART